MLRRNDILILLILVLIALSAAGCAFVVLLVWNDSPIAQVQSQTTAPTIPASATRTEPPFPTPTDAPTLTSTPAATATATDTATATATPPPTRTPVSSPTSPPTSIPITVQPGVRDVGREAARALVKVAVPGDSGNDRTGSGSIVDGEKGLILTNWHIVADDWGDLLNEDGSAGILWVEDPDQMADLVFMARVLPEHSDPDLDFALLQITHRVEGANTLVVQWPLDLPAVTLGDSDQVLPGSPVLLLGYPDYGEGGISWTQGLVTLRDQEWIRSDALISHGHSGGMMLNEAGQMAGILSEVQWIGWKGELALARPVNLAKPLIQGAREQIEPPTGAGPPVFRVPRGQLMIVFGESHAVLRDGPGSNHHELGSLSLGSTVEVLADPAWDGERHWYHVQPLDGSQPGWAADDHLASTEAALRPILFSSNQAGSEDLYKILPNGSELAQLTSTLGDERHASWSPDGDYIVFSQSIHGDADLYAMYADGGKPLQLTEHWSDDIQPVWSPDGRYIAFVSSRDGDPEIFLLNLYSQELEQITANQSWDGFPTWAPDGQRLAFASSRSGNDDLFVIDLATRQETQLTTSPNSESHPAWSPQGGEIAYTLVVSEGDPAWTEIAVLDLRDPAHPRQLTTSGPGQNSHSNPDWSPDGRWIVWRSESEEGARLLLAPSRGGPVVQLADLPGSSDSVLAWSR